jgi:hypothetical protein
VSVAKEWPEGTPFIVAPTPFHLWRRFESKAFHRAFRVRVRIASSDEEKPMEVSSPRSWQRGGGATNSIAEKSLADELSLEGERHEGRFLERAGNAAMVEKTS